MDRRSPIVIAIVDDDPYVRSALSAVLSATDGMTLFAVYDDGAEIVEAGTANVDVVLMDIRMPRMNGIRATQEIKKARQSPEVIMLTTFDLSEEVTESLRAGAAGYVMKDSDPTELVDAIRKVVSGQMILSPSVTRQLVDFVHDSTERRQIAQKKLRALAPREFEVAIAISEGKSNTDISVELFLSVPTVKSHVSSIFTKLDVTSRLQVALFVRDARER